MNEIAKPQRNVAGASKAGAPPRPEMPRRKPGALTPAPAKREEPSRTLRDDEDTLTGMDSDDEEE